MTEEKNNNPLPQTKTPEQIRWDTLRPYLLDPREDYPEPFHMLEFNGVPFSKVGGLAAISGQKKNGKSFVLTQLMAAVLDAPNYEHSGQYLPGLRVPQRTIDMLGHLPKVLYVDTEMEKLSSAKVLRRVHWLCGWDMKYPNDRFAVLWVKTMPKDDTGVKPYTKRLDLIKLAIDAIEPDVVFIDGLRDIIPSINDEEAGTAILDYFGSIAEERNMSIWMALHQNPTKGDADDLKMRGWIGTELGNKVSDTLISIKTKTASGVTFTVKQQDARDKDLDDWKFEITDEAGNLGVPRIISNGTNLPSKSKEQPQCDDPATIREWIQQAKEQYEWPMSRSQIKKAVFGEIGGVKNDGKQQADLNAAINLHFLEESTLKSGGYYMLQPPDDLPF